MTATPVNLLIAPRERRFFGRVESLRGLGAFTIAGFHLAAWPLHGVQLLPQQAWADCTWWEEALRRFGWLLLPGHASLMMFFVISGFVLRHALEHGPQQPRAAAGKFFAARAFRVFPIIVFGVLVTTMFTLLGALPAASVAITTPRVLANLLLFDTALKPELWAIQVEVLLYPAIVALYFAERRSGARVIVAVALAATLLSFSSRWAVWPPLSRNAFAVFLGMALPTYGARVMQCLSRRWAGAALSAAVFLFFCSGMLWNPFSPVGAVIETYAAAVLVSVAAYRDDLSPLRWLDLSALRLAGRSSGSFYVLHMSALPALVWLAALVIPPSWSAASPAIVGLVVVWAALLAMVAIAAAGYYAIEAPGVALGRRVAAWLLPRAIDPAAPQEQLPQRRAA